MKKLLTFIALIGFSSVILSLFSIEPYTDIGTTTPLFNRTNLIVKPNGLNQIFNFLGGTNISAEFSFTLTNSTTGEYYHLTNSFSGIELSVLLGSLAGAYSFETNQNTQATVNKDISVDDGAGNKSQYKLDIFPSEMSLNLLRNGVIMSGFDPYMNTDGFPNYILRSVNDRGTNAIVQIKNGADITFYHRGNGGFVARTTSGTTIINSSEFGNFYARNDLSFGVLEQVTFSLNGHKGKISSTGTQIYVDGVFFGVGGNDNPRTSLDISNDMSFVGTTYNLTSDDIGIGAGTTYKLINSDNATPSNRTFHFNNDQVSGQVMKIVVIAGAAQLLNNDPLVGGTGTLKLDGDWDASTWSAIELISDGTNFIETSRSIK